MKQSYGIHICEEDLELVRALANCEGEVIVIAIIIIIVVIIIIIIKILYFHPKDRTISCIHFAPLADSKECVHPAYQGDAIAGRPQTGNIAHTNTNTNTNTNT